jgi:hypothetical protein
MGQQTSAVAEVAEVRDLRVVSKLGKKLATAVQV